MVYNISYNKNASDTVTYMPSAQNKLKYDTIKLSSNIPVRSGYEFLGWSINTIAEVPDYIPGEDYSDDSNLNLYAVWKATQKEISYKVEYYKDGVFADDDGVVSEIVDVSQNTISVDKSKINTTDRFLGYEFEKTVPAVIPDDVTNGTIIEVHYKVINYTITYDLDSGELLGYSK